MSDTPDPTPLGRAGGVPDNSPASDVIGYSSYDPNDCVRLAEQFEGVARGLSRMFVSISEVKKRKDIFRGVVEQHLSRAFPDYFVFTAELDADDAGVGGKKRYRRGECYRDGELLQPQVWAPGVPIASQALDRAREDHTRVTYSGLTESAEEGLGGLKNLVVVPIWFKKDEVLWLCVGDPECSSASGEWPAPRVKLLHYFPHLIATALRIVNHRSQLSLMERALGEGVASEVCRLGETLFSSRSQLARYAEPEEGTSVRKDPPEVSGDYDGPLADYVDALRFMAATSPPKSKDGSPVSPVDCFCGLFRRELAPGDRRIPLCAMSGASTGAAEEESFVLGRDAHQAQYAVGRAMAWLKYKLQMDASQGDGVAGKSGEHEDLRQRVEKEGNYAPPNEADITQGHARDEWIGWLRYRWVQVFYAAGDIQERRPENGEQLLGELAQNYSQAVDDTRRRLKNLLQQNLQSGESSVRVDWRWLYLWFIGNAVRSGKLYNEYRSYQQGVDGFGDHLSYYRDSAVAVLFALQQLRFPEGNAPSELWDLPELGPDEVTRARIRVLCQYAYREIGVDPSWRLEQHLGAQFQPEMILQAYSPANREHALHVVDVCLLGHLLMVSKTAGDADPVGKHVLGGEREPSDFLRGWYVAALLHDVGRAQEIIHGATKQLDHLGTPDLVEYTKKVEEALAKASTAFDKAIAKQFSEIGVKFAEPLKGISRDHGVVSANHLIHSLKRTVGDDGFLKRLETVEALQAIARHNRRLERFKAREEPLSYLLVLADHLQESSRPRFESRRLAMGFLGATQGASSFRAKGQHAALYMSLKATYDSEENTISLPAGNIKFDLYCAASESGLFEPACQWVETTADLERVEFEDGFPVVELRFVHPASGVLARSRRGLVDMELLRDFAETTDGSFLFSWLRAVKARQGLGYELSGGKEERFTVEFGRRRSGAPTLLHSLPKDFFQKLSTWKKQQLRLIEDI